jgi:hypothetical protein
MPVLLLFSSGYVGPNMSRRKLPPIHPGEILQEEFLGPLGISQYRVANETSVSPSDQ